ncbi:MAG: hypothetical protein WC787_04805 [Patescibacteria group bacterium]|jgi:hypothetical protein
MEEEAEHHSLTRRDRVARILSQTLVIPKHEAYGLFDQGRLRYDATAWLERVSTLIKSLGTARTLTILRNDSRNIQRNIQRIESRLDAFVMDLGLTLDAASDVIVRCMDILDIPPEEFNAKVEHLRRMLPAPDVCRDFIIAYPKYFTIDRLALMEEALMNVNRTPADVWNAITHGEDGTVHFSEYLSPMLKHKPKQALRSTPRTQRLPGVDALRTVPATNDTLVTKPTLALVVSNPEPIPKKWEKDPGLDDDCRFPLHQQTVMSEKPAVIDDAGVQLVKRLATIMSHPRGAGMNRDMAYQFVLRRPWMIKNAHAIAEVLERMQLARIPGARIYDALRKNTGLLILGEVIGHALDYLQVHSEVRPPEDLDCLAIPKKLFARRSMELESRKVSPRTQRFADAIFAKTQREYLTILDRLT